MNVVTIAIGDLFEFEGQPAPAPASPPDEETLLTMARRQFAFLPAPLRIELGHTSLTVTFPAETAPAQQEAARLAQRAAKQAAAGEFAKAISLLKRVLGLQPTFHQARRDLAMACLETGDVDSAKNHLIEVLRLNPGDAWSWVVLGNVYAKDPQEWATAEKFFRRALAVAPTDAWALNGLATIAGQRGQTDEAVRLFQEAIATKPEFPNAHYGLAIAYHRAQQPESAIRSLNGLFANARALDARSRPVFDQARQLYAELQNGQAERQHSEARQAVEKFQAEMEQASGYPVRVLEGEFADTTGANIQMAWKHGRDHHLVTLRKTLPEHLRTHFLAHELTHLQLESEARAAGRNRFFLTTDKTEAAAIERFQSAVRKLAKRGYSERAIGELSRMWFRGTVNFLFNCPLDMVIETRLRSRWPALTAAQFVSTRMSVQEALRVNTKPEIREITPPAVLRACLALNGAFALFLDTLYSGATNYVAHYQREESFAIAQRLFRHWQSRSSQLGPGDEYALIDEFAEMTGLRSWFDWRLDPGLQDTGASPASQGTSNPELLEAKEAAAVQYLLDALRRYDALPEEKVREIALEIGVVGQRGLDYASPEAKYELKSLPGEKFSGLQLMCLMYAGFKRIAPEEDLGMNLEKPYAKALELFRGATGDERTG